jgi:hypothetical protein
MVPNRQLAKKGNRGLDDRIGRPLSLFWDGAAEMFRY